MAITSDGHRPPAWPGRRRLAVDGGSRRQPRRWAGVGHLPLAQFTLPSSIRRAGERRWRAWHGARGCGRLRSFCLDRACLEVLGDPLACKRPAVVISLPGRSGPSRRPAMLANGLAVLAGLCGLHGGVDLSGGFPPSPSCSSGDGPCCAAPELFVRIASASDQFSAAGTGGPQSASSCARTSTSLMKPVASNTWSSGWVMC